MFLWKKESSNDGAMYVKLWSSQECEFDDEKIKQKLIGFGIENCKKNDEKASDFRKRGNEKCQAKCWREAMELYNKCLRYATGESENISLAYANRSVCFLKMEMHYKCLEDISLAKYANYPQRLMSKLDERQVFCMDRMMSHMHLSNSYRSVKIKMKLSFDADKAYPCLANVLEIRTNDEFGRHIVAKEDIGVGEAVLMDESFVSDTSLLNNTCCKTCLQYTKNFIHCSGCTDVMFCNYNCMEANNIHKIACGSPFQRFPLLCEIVDSILIGIGAFSSADDMMMFVKSALETPESIDLPESTSILQMKYRLFLKVMPLSHPPDEFDESLFPTLYLMLIRIPEIKRKFNTQSKQRFLMHLIQQHMLILMRNGLTQNAFGGDEPIQIIGTISPFLNHSCFPNILITNFGKQLIGHIVRPVKRGEQLFSRYYHEHLPTEQQQAYLHEKFQFQCKCSKCLPSYNEEDRVRMQLDPRYQFIIGFDKDSMIMDAMTRPLLILKCYEFMDKYGRLPWSKEIEEVLNRLKIGLDLYFNALLS